MCICLPKGMYNNVHSSFIYQFLNQKLPMSTISRMEKLSTANVHSNKKRTYSNMDESHRHNHNQKKADTERYCMITFT